MTAHCHDGLDEEGDLGSAVLEKHRPLESQPVVLVILDWLVAQQDTSSGGPEVAAYTRPMDRENLKQRYRRLQTRFAAGILLESLRSESGNICPVRPTVRGHPP